MKTHPLDKTGRKRIENADDIFTKGLEAVWLGQSGFLFSLTREEGHRTLVLTDAYLSDFLTENDLGLPFSHERMLTSPLTDTVLKQIDYVLITHGHEDHMDPDLMKKMAEINSKAVYIIPPGCRRQLIRYGIRENQIQQVLYKKETIIEEDFRIEAFPAAHPEPEFDQNKSWALSYDLKLGGFSLFFAGDTTIYPKLMAWLESRRFDLLVCPVNGRDPEKEKKGIVGNMSFEEAVILSLHLKTPLLGTHFGMFAFNTIDPEEKKKWITNFRMENQIMLTEEGILYAMA